MLLSDIRSVVRSRTRSGLWRTIKAPPGQLRCPPIRKQGVGNSGFSNVVDPATKRDPLPPIVGSGLYRSLATCFIALLSISMRAEIGSLDILI
jgi:hypothetical protein